MVRFRGMRGILGQAIVCGVPALALVCAALPARATVKCRGMSVRDMINVTRFIPLESYTNAIVSRSPDSRYVMAVTEKGDLSSNSVQDALLVWKLSDVFGWLHGDGPRPRPVLTLVRRSKNEISGGPDDGPIRDVKWYSRSDDILFRGARNDGHREAGLYRVSISGNLQLLSERNQDVRYYTDQGDEIVYETGVTTPRDLMRMAMAQDAKPYFVGTGRSLYKLLFPTSSNGSGTDEIRIWKTLGIQPVQIALRSTQWYENDLFAHVLSISPKHTMAVMDLPVRHVPARWAQYGHGSNPFWRRTGRVPAGGVEFWMPAQYVMVNLMTGRMRSGTRAPDGHSRGFYGISGYEGVWGASWAPDGAAVLLYNTFVAGSAEKAADAKNNIGWGVSHPCIAVHLNESNRTACVEGLLKQVHGRTLLSVRWERTNADRIVTAWTSGKSAVQVLFCIYPSSVQWIRQCGKVLPGKMVGSDVQTPFWIKESLNSPPELAAALPNSGTDGRVLYDPNADLRTRCMGSAHTVALHLSGNGVKDVVITAGVLLPVGYVRGSRYPLVIQTHAYQPDRFFSSGYAPPFAGRSLAAAGFVVMQLPFCPRDAFGTVEYYSYPIRMRCNVMVFQAAIQYAINHGLVDAHKIGIIGWSASCEPVIAALENSGFHFAAGELADGVLNTYREFVDNVSFLHGFFNAFEIPGEGEAPFGPGLSWWVDNSLGFSMYKIKAPLLVQANGRRGVLAMWEPYAVLHYLGRAVDLVILQKGTHPTSNPMQRLASQQLTVDWFRFWLQGKRPESDVEYRRWQDLRSEASN